MVRYMGVAWVSLDSEGLAPAKVCGSWKWCWVCLLSVVFYLDASVNLIVFPACFTYRRAHVCPDVVDDFYVRQEDVFIVLDASGVVSELGEDLVAIV